MNPIKKAIREAQEFYHLKVNWLGAGGHPVDQHTAQKRANVCLDCPCNQDEGVFEDVKGGVADITRKQIEIKNELKLRVQGEKSLHICEPCGCVLRLLVWVPDRHLKDQGIKPEDYPAHCWKAKL